MNSLMARSGYIKKGRRMILKVSLAKQNKDEVLKLTNKSLIINPYLVNNKCKCADEISLSVFINGFKQKSLIFFIIIECNTQSSSSLLF